jgi:hypothetical protein
MSAIGRGGRAWATAAAVVAVGFVGTVVYRDQVAPPQVAGNGATTAIASGADIAARANSRTDLSEYLRAHQENAEMSSLSPMRQYMRPAMIVQAQ